MVEAERCYRRRMRDHALAKAPPTAPCWTVNLLTRAVVEKGSSSRPSARPPVEAIPEAVVPRAVMAVALVVAAVVAVATIRRRR